MSNSSAFKFLQLLVFLPISALLCQARSTAAKSKPTPIFIDAVPSYKDLSACAELPLKTIVRNMVGGCGDNSEMTSYDCFCVSSYSKFSWDISTAVVSNCGSELAAQATGAVAVFQEYCASGTTQLPVPVIPTPTATG